MITAIKEKFLHEMQQGKANFSNDELEVAFYHFERAHILGQRYFWPHMITHFYMFLIGLKRADAREIFGQITRMIAVVPGFVFGWVPKGNTGGANVSPIKPMDCPEDMELLLSDYNVWSDVKKRILLAIIIICFSYFEPF